MKNSMEDIVNYCKNYGFVFQGSEIYGGLSNSWDYGSLGKELKENIRKAWWKKFIQEVPNNYGLDAAIIMNPNVWVASGHVTSFADPLMDCKKCKSRYRADKLIEDFTEGKETGDGWDNKKLEEFIKENHIKCPKCGSEDFTDIRKFNLLFETHIGVTEDAKSVCYLRGETAQGIFTNFLNVQRSMRCKIPFGIGQTGKSFRNEITPGNFIFRTREFEQMELEFFCKPGTDLEWFKFYKDYCMNFLKSLGLKEENLRYRDHKPEELAFYSKATTDIEYLFPMGFKYCHCYRYVKACAIFPYISRRKIYCHSFRRQYDIIIMKCGFNPFLCLPYLRCNISNHIKNRHTCGYINFNTDRYSLYSA